MRITATTHHGNFYHVETVDADTVDDLRALIAAGPYSYPHALNDLTLVQGLFTSLQETGEAWHGWTHYEMEHESYEDGTCTDECVATHPQHSSTRGEE